jgi:hypothetical protein
VATFPAVLSKAQQDQYNAGVSIIQLNFQNETLRLCRDHGAALFSQI